MTHTEQLQLAKSAALGRWLSKPLMSTPGFAKLRSARRMLQVQRSSPTVQEMLEGIQGYYDPARRTVNVFHGATDPRDTLRHELLHGYQDVSLRMAKNPMATYGAKDFRQGVDPGSFTSGMRNLALELDARIGASRSIPAGLADMARSAPAYAKDFTGLGKLPYATLGLLGKLLPSIH